MCLNQRWLILASKEIDALKNSTTHENTDKIIGDINPIEKVTSALILKGKKCKISRYDPNLK